MNCNSSNLIYVIIIPTCKEEYIGETGIGKTTLRDRVRVYRQHINQPHYQQLKVEEHIRTFCRLHYKAVADLTNTVCVSISRKYT